MILTFNVKQTGADKLYYHAHAEGACTALEQEAVFAVAKATQAAMREFLKAKGLPTKPGINQMVSWPNQRG